MHTWHCPLSLLDHRPDSFQDFGVGLSNVVRLESRDKSVSSRRRRRIFLVPSSPRMAEHPRYWPGWLGATSILRQSAQQWPPLWTPVGEGGERGGGGGALSVHVRSERAGTTNGLLLELFDRFNMRRHVVRCRLKLLQQLFGLVHDVLVLEDGAVVLKVDRRRLL